MKLGPGLLSLYKYIKITFTDTSEEQYDNIISLAFTITKRCWSNAASKLQLICSFGVMFDEDIELKEAIYQQNNKEQYPIS